MKPTFAMPDIPNEAWTLKRQLIKHIIPRNLLIKLVAITVQPAPLFYFLDLKTIFSLRRSVFCEISKRVAVGGFENGIFSYN